MSSAFSLPHGIEGFFPPATKLLNSNGMGRRDRREAKRRPVAYINIIVCERLKNFSISITPLLSSHHPTNRNNHLFTDDYKKSSPHKPSHCCSHKKNVDPIKWIVRGGGHMLTGQRLSSTSSTLLEIKIARSMAASQSPDWNSHAGSTLAPYWVGG